jgi:ribosomal-protein-alanine N-acetyltransferase
MNKIYKATVCNISNIAQLEKECFSSTLSEQDIKALIKSDVFSVYVLETDRCFSGHCVTYTILEETEITSFAISPLFRSKGLGFLFLTKIIETQKEKEVEKIFLEVRASNEKALNLYKKMGFSIDRIRTRFYEKPVEDAYAMSLKINK